MDFRNNVVFALSMVVALVALSSLTVPGLNAWTGGHSDMARDIGEAGNLESQHVDRLAGQAHWADKDAAEDGDGTYGISEEHNPWQDKYLLPFCCTRANMDHWYEVGTGVGDAPQNTRRFIGWSAQWYINNGYTNYGFKMLGRGLHYPQDMSMPYHTTAISNLENFGDNHGKYENWHDRNYDSESFGQFIKWGAEYGADYTITEDDGLAKHTRELAKETEDRVDAVDNGDWTQNVYETKWAMYDFGERASAMIDYAAPGHSDF